jgi:hypothetical protein
MAHFIRFVWLFFLFFALLLSCKKPQPNEPQESIGDDSLENMKDWYFFKTGSWWIYREENTGMVDTVTVYSYSEALYGENNLAIESFEWHSHDNHSVVYRFNAIDECNLHPECKCLYIQRSRSKPGDFVGAFNAFTYPMLDQNYHSIFAYVNGGVYEGYCTLSYPFLPFIINADTLTETAKWNIEADISMNGQPATYTIAKNIGIVEIEYPDSNYVWKLVDWHVLQ